MTSHVIIEVKRHYIKKKSHRKIKGEKDKGPKN